MVEVAAAGVVGQAIADGEQFAEVALGGDLLNQWDPLVEQVAGLVGIAEVVLDVGTPDQVGGVVSAPGRGAPFPGLVQVEVRASRIAQIELTGTGMAMEFPFVEPPAPSGIVRAGTALQEDFSSAPVTMPSSASSSLRTCCPPWLPCSVYMRGRLAPICSTSFSPIWPPRSTEVGWVGSTSSQPVAKAARLRRLSSCDPRESRRARPFLRAP
ncbi:hypothetical protein ABT061_14750 [Streptosporangium sp. NPDC002544]|uniref:hypothetical protein n=1 Tax=Streptosporangium sp. NPDC002544 TaxID=3154538 RepID=UPI00332B4141